MLSFFMSLYRIWPIPNVVRGILKVLLSDSVWLVVSQLSWAVFHYYVKYFVFSNCNFVINLYAFFRFLLYVVSRNRIHVFFLYVW